MLYEGGVRVPMAVQWPGRIQPGVTCEVPVSVIDFFPTLRELAGLPGLPESAEPPVDGESLVPLLKQSGSWLRDTLYWHFPSYLEGGAGMWRTTPGAALRHGEWKLIEFFEDGRLELYNLNDDIGERHNLAAALPEKTRELQEKMRSWRERVQAPMPTELNPLFGIGG